MMRPGLSVILATFVACADAPRPQIIYTNGHATVRFGKDSVDLGGMPVAPRLSEYKHNKTGALFLIEFSRGDSCPSQYLALLHNNGYRNLGEIGNCNEVKVDTTPAESIRLIFDGINEPNLPEPRRKKLTLKVTAVGLSAFPD